MNTAANKDIYSERIVIPLKGDNHDSIRKEYSKMLRDQLATDDNGLIKTKYLTFGVDADSMKRSSAPIPVPTVVSWRMTWRLSWAVDLPGRLSGLFDIENTKTEPQKERRQEEK